MNHAKPSILAFALLELFLLLWIHPLLVAQDNQTALERAASQLNPGEWVELTTSFAENPLIEDIGGHHILQYTDNAEWDPFHQQFLFLGQGHSSNYDDDPSTGSRFIRYSEFQNQWAVLPEIPVNNVGHGYDHSAFNPETGDFFHRPANGLTVYRYNTIAESWSSLPSLPMQSIQVAGALAYFPEMGGLLFVDGDWGVWFFDEIKNKWQQLANTNGGGNSTLPNLAMGAYSNFAEYSPVHRVVVFGGGNDSKAIYRLDAAGDITALQEAPMNLGIQWGSISTVDPVSGDFLFFGPQEEFYVFNPINDSWKAINNSRPLFFDVGLDGPISGTVATPVSTHGVVMFLNYDRPRSQVYIYKHTEAATVNIGPEISFHLKPNYPNPFKESTQIPFSLQQSGNIIINIYDQTGRLVTTLLNEHKPIGDHEITWNAKDQNGQLLAEGIYFLCMESKGINSRRKMLLMR